MNRIFSALGCLLFLAIFFGGAGCRKKVSAFIDTVACPVNQTVNKLKITQAYYNSRVQQKTNAFYEQNGFKKEWLDGRRPTRRYEAFVAEVKGCARYGMNPDDYHIAELDKEVQEFYKGRKRTEDEASLLDIRITAAFFLYTTHLLEGRVRKPGARDFIWKRGMPAEDDVALLHDLKGAKDVRKEFARLQPKDPMYSQLQDALALYRHLADEKLPILSLKAEQKIKPGDRHERIPDIRYILNFTDLERHSAPDDSLLYDEQLAEGVRRFQRRHGLTDDGVIGSREIGFMNIPFQKRAETIALNLERLRWRPYINYDHETIMVNIPEYVMRVVKDKKTLLQMRVVLGSEFNPTPIFSDTLTYIVFSPTWNVPPKIFEEEFLPNLIRDPGYYSKNGSFKFLKDGVEIDPESEDWKASNLNPRAYQAIQNPGERNSLGYVKFVMPNNYNIYLHDTPADRLFNKEDRAFSHGCIRLEKPFELASLLLEDQKDHWDKQAILDAMNAQEPVHVKLKKSYPVHIVYRTAWVDEEGLVNFREDLYGHDERHLKQLTQPTLTPLALNRP